MTIEELPLDPLDVRPVGHDEHRIAVEHAQVALEQQRDLAGVCRPREQRQALAGGHRPIVDLRSDGPPSAAQTESGMCVKRARLLAGSCRLRLAPSARGGVPGHLACAIVAEVGLLRAAPGIGVVQSEGRAFAFTDFTAAVIAN